MDVDMDNSQMRTRLSSSGSFSGLSNGSSAGASGSNHELKFRVYNDALLHASTCPNKHCMALDGRCHKIKASIDHFVRCYGPRRKVSSIESCSNCARIWGLLCYHAKTCPTPHGQHCVVSQCDYLREKIARKMQADQAELQRAQSVLQAREEWTAERRIAQLEADRIQVMQIIEQIRAEKARLEDMAL